MVIDPDRRVRTGLRFLLVMQAALIAAKYHPDIADPGRWRLEPHEGMLRVVSMDVSSDHR